MNVLVANLGSTSFKYRLFAMGAEGERVVAKGGYERVTDFGTVIQEALDGLVAQGHLRDLNDLDAVGFKTVLGKNLSGCVPADETCIAALEGLARIAPSHNPAYVNGIRQFSRLTRARLVALFETSFYQWIPEAATRYAVPESWYTAGVRRYGFHGASHKFIAERSAELLGRADIAERVRQLYVAGPGAEPEQALRVVSLHLGGSSSVCGIRSGVSIGASMGLSPQGGLPQNNRVGDLDTMAIPLVLGELGLSMEEALRQLTKESGLLGLSGVSNDCRDIHAAADQGNPQARRALEVFVHSIRHWLGAFAFQMGGLDAVVFTAGIGENDARLRAAVCTGLEGFGLRLDPMANARLSGPEACISAADSAVKVLVIPTNEELVVARETKRLLESSPHSR